MAYSDFYMTPTGSDLNAGSTAADNAVYTSTAGNWDGTSIFTPTDGTTTSSLVNVGDWASIYPTGNSTTPYVAQVTTVGAGANGTITLSTTIKYGTAPTSNSGSRNCKTGGAWTSLAMVASGSALATGTVPLSTRINLKVGTYANTTTTRTFALAGSATLGLWWRGYKGTTGDQDTNNVAVAGTDIPSLTYTTGQMVVSGANQIFSNIDINSACTTANGAVSCTVANLTFYRCRIQNTAANAASRAWKGTGANNVLIACYLKSTSSAEVAIGNSVNGLFLGCTFTGGTAGINNAASTPLAVINCVFDSQGNDGILLGSSSNLFATGNSFYACIGNGIKIPATVVASVIANNYFENVNQASKSAINNTSGTNTNLITCVGNAYFNCTANLAGITESFAIFDNGTLGSAGFATPGSQVFSMNPVGQALGFPGTFENVSAYQGYRDVGAVQGPHGSPARSRTFTGF